MTCSVFIDTGSGPLGELKQEERRHSQRGQGRQVQPSVKARAPSCPLAPGEWVELRRGSLPGEGTASQNVQDKVT